MNPILMRAFDKVLETIKKDERCLGAWHFGSISRGLQDDLSDVDPVFLIKEEHFEGFAAEIPDILRQACDKLILTWPEEYNNGSFKNFCSLIMIDGQIFQHDFFLMNAGRTEEHFCWVHYADCSKESILFDHTGVVEGLIDNRRVQTIPDRNILRLIDKYWFHLDMLVKYFLRGDIFKLQLNIRYQYLTHADILLSKYQKTTWGGWESLIKYDLPKEKQKHLLPYFCTGEIDDMRKAMYTAMDLFSKDAREICREAGLEYPEEIERLIMEDFRKRTG